MFQLAANPCTLLGWWPRASFFWRFRPFFATSCGAAFGYFWRSSHGFYGILINKEIFHLRMWRTSYKKRQLKDSVGAQSPRALSRCPSSSIPPLAFGRKIRFVPTAWSICRGLVSGTRCHVGFQPSPANRLGLHKLAPIIDQKVLSAADGLLRFMSLIRRTFFVTCGHKDEIEKGCDGREDEWRLQRRTLNGPNTWYRSSRLVWRLGGVASCQLIRRKKNVEPNMNQWTRGSKKATRPCSLCLYMNVCQLASFELFCLICVIWRVIFRCVPASYLRTWGFGSE